MSEASRRYSVIFFYATTDMVPKGTDTRLLVAWTDRFNE